MLRSYSLCLTVLAVMVVVEYCFAEAPTENPSGFGPFSNCCLTDVLEVVGEVFIVFLITISKCGRRRRRTRTQSIREVPTASQASCKTGPVSDRLPTLLCNRNESESFRPKRKHSDSKAQPNEHVAERCHLSDAMHACVQQGDLDGAIDALKRFSQIASPSMDDYKAVITLCAKKDEPELAHLWLRSAAEKAGTPKTSVCHNAVMNAYAKRGDVAQAITVATGMVKAGLELDTVSYNILIDAAARVGDADAAEKLMTEMQADGINASVISFSLVIRACASAGRPNSAEAWLEQADKQGIELNMISYSAIISAFAKNQDLQSANAWLNTMISRGVVASVHCFTSILHVLVHQGDMQQATQLVEKMRAVGVQLDTGIYSLLVQGAIWAEDVQGAHSWAHEAFANGINLPKTARSMLRPTHWVPRKAHDDSRSARTSAHNQSARDTVGLANSQLEVDSALDNDFLSKRFNGTIKEFVPSRFGHITCAETIRVYHRDVYLSSQHNPAGFVKGQRVSFKLYFDKSNKFPRAYDLRPFQVN